MRGLDVLVRRTIFLIVCFGSTAACQARSPSVGGATTVSTPGAWDASAPGHTGRQDGGEPEAEGGTINAPDTHGAHDLHRDPFLRPFVAELRASTPPEALTPIAEASFANLILFHHGYGTGIRNKWLWGERNPSLLAFFRQHGVLHPDDMSMVLIEALWDDLNTNLSAEESERRQRLRSATVQKRTTYARLEHECETFLAPLKSVFEACYVAHGLPSKNPLNHDPFFKLVVNRTGGVGEVVYFEGASNSLRACLGPLLTNHRFSSFDDADILTLYVTNFPSCRVQERDAR